MLHITSTLANRIPRGGVALLIAALTAFSLTGCAEKRNCAANCCNAAQQPTHWGIPLGEWSGEGAFVYECARANVAAPAEGKAAADECAGVASIARRYKTSLKISRSTLGGHDVVEFSILSQRGDIPQLENRTQLRFALEQRPAPQIEGASSDKLRLYRMVAAEFNRKQPNPDYQYDPNTDAVSRASLFMSDGCPVLQIVYSDNFVDTICFCGSMVQKSGSYFDGGIGAVHWVERMSRN